LRDVSHSIVTFCFSWFFWQGDRLVEEIPRYADGTPVYDAAIQWLYKGDEPEPFARYEKGQLHYVVCDQIGTPRELFDERGNLKWSAKSDVWGLTQVNAHKAANDEIAPDCNLRFLGQYYDCDKFVRNKFE